jgi:uncharacterized protein YbaA (DUF1428 family)
MARYVDGFLLPVPKKKLAAYKAISRKAGKIWREHGALEYVECVLDDQIKFGVPFAKAAKPKPGEVVVLSWILYKSKTQRDAVNKKVMADSRLQANMTNMPFDTNRMSMAGFKTLVDL